MTKHPSALALFVFVACSLAEFGSAFQSHRPLLPPTLGVETTKNDRFVNSAPRIHGDDHARSPTALRALPVAAAASAVRSLAGTALATLAGAIFPSSASGPTKVLRASILLLAGLVASSTRIRHRLLYPGLAYPEAEGAEMLPGPVGCPFIGTPQVYTRGDPSFGAGNFYRTTAHKLGKALGHVPKIWKYYLFGNPFVLLSGGKTFQKVLNMEFDGSVTSAGVELLEGGLVPVKSLLCEQDKKRHSYLRRLVGSALTPAAVAKAAPTLQSAAEEQVTKMLRREAATTATTSPEAVKFHKVCTDYTLDVAWRQILGLELTEEEIPVFEEQVATWIAGIMSLQVVLHIGVESHPGYAAREYLIGKIEEKIDQLLERGPDHQSTLSGMVFATDDEENGTTGKKLSRQEIIDNALILIFAGSETSASTLTNAMMFLGLHPSVWKNLVEEQAAVRQSHGDALTTHALDPNNSPYLDAFLKETMRMRTVVEGIPRKTLKEVDVDGDGKTIIPKGYLINPSMLMTHEEDPVTKLPNGMHLDPIQGFRPQRWLGQTNREVGMGADPDDYQKPNTDWYVPYGFGPRYCLGKNLAQLEMKIFLATMARSLDFPELTMLPEDYDYSPLKKDPEATDYFSVAWAKTGAVIPIAGDGVMATVRPAKPSRSDPEDDDDAVPVVVPIAKNIAGLGASNATATDASLRA